MNSGCQDFTTSCRLDFRTSVSTEVSTEFSHSVSTEVSQSLFGRASLPGPSILTGLVPEVGFGNGWFASLRWPANKRERDVIFDPFLSPRNIICFGTQQAVFSVTRNILGNENSLPARGGGENSSEVVVFYRAPRVPRPIFKRSTGPRHFHSKLAPQNLVFAHYRTKNGANPAGFAPGKGSIRSNFSRIKHPICSLALAVQSAF